MAHAILERQRAMSSSIGLNIDKRDSVVYRCRQLEHPTLSSTSTNGDLVGSSTNDTTTAAASTTSINKQSQTARSPIVSPPIFSTLASYVFSCCTLPGECCDLTDAVITNVEDKPLINTVKKNFKRKNAGAIEVLTVPISSSLSIPSSPSISSSPSIPSSPSISASPSIPSSPSISSSPSIPSSPAEELPSVGAMTEDQLTSVGEKYDQQCVRLISQSMNNAVLETTIVSVSIDGNQVVSSTFLARITFLGGWERISVVPLSNDDDRQQLTTRFLTLLKTLRPVTLCRKLCKRRSRTFTAGDCLTHDQQPQQQATPLPSFPPAPPSPHVSPATDGVTTTVSVSPSRTQHLTERLLNSTKLDGPHGMAHERLLLPLVSLPIRFVRMTENANQLISVTFSPREKHPQLVTISLTVSHDNRHGIPLHSLLRGRAEPRHMGRGRSRLVCCDDQQNSQGIDNGHSITTHSMMSPLWTTSTTQRLVDAPTRETIRRRILSPHKTTQHVSSALSLASIHGCLGEEEHKESSSTVSRRIHGVTTATATQIDDDEEGTAPCSIQSSTSPTSPLVALLPTPDANPHSSVHARPLSHSSDLSLTHSTTMANDHRVDHDAHIDLHQESRLPPPPSLIRVNAIGAGMGAGAVALLTQRSGDLFAQSVKRARSQIGEPSCHSLLRPVSLTSTGASYHSSTQPATSAGLSPRPRQTLGKFPPRPPPATVYSNNEQPLSRLMSSQSSLCGRLGWTESLIAGSQAGDERQWNAATMLNRVFRPLAQAAQDVCLTQWEKQEKRDREEAVQEVLKRQREEVLAQEDELQHVNGYPDQHLEDVD